MSGLVVAWVARAVMPRGRHGLLSDLLLGMLGGCVGGCVNYKGRVSSLVPGCQVTWTFTDKNGKVKDVNKIYKSSTGHNAPTLAPLQPHANTLVARTCESCHTNPKAVGYGMGKSRSAGQLEGERPQFADQSRGHYGDIPGSARAKPQIPKVPGFPYAWDQLVTRGGKQTQNMPLPEDRPLNRAERDKTEREGSCIACHQHYNTPTWDAVRDRLRSVLGVTGRALTPEEHDRALEAAIKALAGETKTK